MQIFRFIILAVSLIILAGCSNSNNPLEPHSPDHSTGSLSMQTLTSGVNSNNNRYLWGYWNVTISSDCVTAEIVPSRNVSLHLNAVNLLEFSPCDTCLTFNNVALQSPNELHADLTLTHPYPGLDNYTGFDVRGIFMATADYFFPECERAITLSPGAPRLLNPDGYTPLFNPVEFPETFPLALGYIQGHYASDFDSDTTLNPFLAYRMDAPRCMFEAGAGVTRTIHAYIPGPFLEFGYAVDCSWQLVQEPVTDPLNDFPPDANCLEAYRINAEIIGNPDPNSLVPTPIEVEIFDHQGLGTISSVTVESPELFDGAVSLSYSTTTGEEGHLFTGGIMNDLNPGIGEYPVLIRIVDTQADQNLGVVDAYQICVGEVTVGMKDGWARAWGSIGDDNGIAVVADDFGNVYNVGWFSAPCDFDCGPGVEERDSNCWKDFYLVKYNSIGSLQWVITMEEHCDGVHVYEIGLDISGNIYIAGQFSSTVDFDTGPGIDERSGGGIFLWKMNSEGEHQWVRTWEDIEYDTVAGIAVSGTGKVYICGIFGGTRDFDPTDQTDERTASGYKDCYLVKYDTDGNYLWVRTWGSAYEGEWGDYCSGVSVDDSNKIYVTGQFPESLDFDPGPDSDVRTSNGNKDAFLTKFDSDGNHIWVNAWGSDGSDSARWNAIDISGNIYVIGLFANTVDFDPGPGEEERTAAGDMDMYLLKFDSGGNHHWVASWGSTCPYPYCEYCNCIDINHNDEMYICGYFMETVDFDPGPGTDEWTSGGQADMFLSKFNTNGEFQWARAWGAPLGGIEDATGVSTNSLGEAYVTGHYHWWADFDPGPGHSVFTANGGQDAYLVKYPPDGIW